MRSPASVSTLTMTRSPSGPVNGLPARASSPVTILKRRPKSVAQLALPVPDQAGGRNDEHAPNEPAREHLADVQPGHDGLAGAGVIGQEESKPRLRQHVVVDGDALMGQRVDAGDFRREGGVEDVAVG